MVDFRYHVVSIVAVFLALGIGIVFGTTAINRAILDDLDRNVSRLTTEKRGLEADRKKLTDDVHDDEAWAKAVFSTLVEGALSGERVVVISAPGASKSVRDDVVRQLKASGAAVVGRIRLSPALADPSRAAELDDLVVRELPQGLTLPPGATAGQRAVAEVAYVTGLAADDTAPPAAVPPSATTRVLAALRERGFVAVDGGNVSPARNVVVVLPGAPPTETPSPTASPLPREPGTDFLTALAGMPARPAVVAVAPTGGSVSGSALEAIRADALLQDSVSTVDDADTVYGQAALVLALVEARHGGTGHYGTGVGADAPVPTPSASP